MTLVGCSNDFLDTTPKTQPKKEIINKLGFTQDVYSVTNIFKKIRE